MITNQYELLHQYINDCRPKLNKRLFERSDEDIIRYLEDIILSCERPMGNGFFSLKVQSFNVIENYEQVIGILNNYQENYMNKSVKSKSIIDNKYKYIDLKDSDLKLLIVNYDIQTYDGYHDNIEVIIAVPRVVDKFYFRINGNYKSPMYQIVDASTYNNGTSNSSKNLNVTFKSVFQPIRVFRNLNTLEDIHGENVTVCTYEVNIFKHSVELCKYIFAKMGLNTGLKFLGLSKYFVISTTPMPENIYYNFLPKKTSGIYISVVKIALTKSLAVQHVLYALHSEFTKKFAVIPYIYYREFWIDALGRQFNLATPRKKGLSVLSSLEFIYDKITQKQTKLPEVDKKNVYTILRWILYEFDNLANKDNLDVSIKRLRSEEYIASLYAAKLSKGIYKLSDLGEKITLKDIRRNLVTDPMHLINEIAKCPLVNFRDMMTDNDSFVANKYSFKGPSGIGESGSKAIPDIYKYVHISNVGIVDMDSSVPSDPGTSGAVVPLIELYDNNYFIDYKEPNSWREQLNTLYNNYRTITKVKEVVSFKKNILNDNNIPELKVRDLETTQEILKKLLPKKG